MNWRQTVDRDLQLVNKRWSDVRKLANNRSGEMFRLLHASVDAGASKSK